MTGVGRTLRSPIRPHRALGRIPPTLPDTKTDTVRMRQTGPTTDSDRQATRLRIADSACRIFAAIEAGAGRPLTPRESGRPRCSTRTGADRRSQDCRRMQRCPVCGERSGPNFGQLYVGSLPGSSRMPWHHMSGFCGWVGPGSVMPSSGSSAERRSAAGRPPGYSRLTLSATEMAISTCWRRLAA